MEYVYAAMLLHKSGKEITAEALGKTLQAAGTTVDDARAKATAAALNGVDIEKVITETQLSAGSAAAPAEASGDASQAEAPKKEAKPEPVEADVSEGLGALFG